MDTSNTTTIAISQSKPTGINGHLKYHHSQFTSGLEIGCQRDCAIFANFHCKMKEKLQ
jgi:hypothetical protein